MALGVLAIGVVALFGMISHIQNANRSMAFQNSSLDAFARIAAQIEDARCDYTPTAPAFATATKDPGLATLDVWIETPAFQSNIDLVGNVDTNPAFPLLDSVPALSIRYMVSLEDPASFLAGPTPTAPALDIQVEVREYFRDPIRDDPTITDAYYVRNFPVKKLCNARYEAVAANARGEY